MRRAFLLLLLLLVACGRSSLASGPTYASSQVSEAAVVPPGFERGDPLRASCSRASLGSLIEGASLADVDCSFARLTRMLKAEAGARSQRLIVDRRCRGSGRALSCSAVVARPTSRAPLFSAETAAEGPAPSPAEVLDLDEPRPQEGSLIRVAFAPRDAAWPRRPARAYHAVAETRLPSVGWRELGDVSASCDGCEGSALRHALRVTAGRVGASEVSQVRCVQRELRRECVATALEPWSS